MRSIDLLKPYLKEKRWIILTGIACLMGVDLLQLVVPRVIKWAIDNITLGNTHDSLGRHGAAIVGLALAIGLLRYIWRRCLMGTARRIEEGLRNRLFGHAQLLSEADLADTPIGDVMALLTNDIANVRMAAGMGLVALVDALVLGVMAIGFMAYISPLLTLIALLPMPLIALSARFFSHRMHQRYHAVNERFGTLTESIRERMLAIPLIKAMNLNAYEHQAVDSVSSAYVQDNLQLIKVTGTFFPLMVFLGNLSLAVVIIMGGYQTILMAITPGDFVAFISYIGLITWPMMAMGWVTSLVQRGRASLTRITKLLDIEPALGYPSPVGHLKATAPHIRIEGLSFGYPHQTGTAIQNISLDLPPGTTLGIVGPPGAGKTTLLKLIGRHFDPLDGTVRFNGRASHQIPLSELRGQISYMPQEAFVFSGRVRDNITLGADTVDPSRLHAVCRQAAILDTIEGMPKQFDTLVGEKGVILSGGQRQRLALARTLYFERSVMLLDDPVSQVDATTAHQIVTQLKHGSFRDILVIVSHRLGVLGLVDQIVVMDRGAIVARGSHRQLLHTSDYYRRTHAIQEMEAALYAV